MPERFADEQYRKLFIGGLTFNTDDEQLKAFYEQWGEIVDCIVMRDPSSKRSRGFGFVTYKEVSQLDEAMKHRPHTIDGKEVEPKRAVPREFSNKPENHLSVKKLYVSGIKEDHTEDALREYFTKYGNVVECDIIIDKGTGKKRGFAFVNFDDYDPVDRCVLEKSHQICNKRCDVKKALSKEEMRRIEQQERERMSRDNRSGFGNRGGDWSNPFHGGYGGYGGGYGPPGYGGGYSPAWGAPGNQWQGPWGSPSYGGGYGGGYSGGYRNGY